MRVEYSVVIADTTCFILLDKIGELELLKSLFGNVTTTPVVVREFGADLPEWVKIKTVTNTQFQDTLQLDPGEASAITLALESENALVIIDDGKGRKVAKRLKLNITGSLGIFLKAKQIGIISSVKPIISKVQETNFRYTADVINEILTLAAE